MQGQWNFILDLLRTPCPLTMLCSFIGAVALTTGFVNSNTGIIWLDQVTCSGTERRLIDCPANALGLHDCSNFEDAGVRCVARESKYTLMNYILCYYFFTFSFSFKKLAVRESSGFEEEPHCLDVLSSVLITLGVLCVMTLLANLMPLWPADSLASVLQVRISRSRLLPQTGQ